MAKILVVDDQESILKTVDAILKKKGHEVVLAGDGYIALEMIMGQRYDLIITDAMMPGISGFDLVKSLRMQDNTKHTPIIMLTSKTERRDVEKAISVKVDDYVIKPIFPEIFIAKVEGMLNKSGRNANVAEALVSEDADFKTPVRVTSVSEIGLTMTCSHGLMVGSRIPAHGSLFSKIGIPPQEMRVISSQHQGDSFVIHAEFANISPANLEKLKQWIVRQDSKSKAG